MRTEDLEFELPQELIAQEPVTQRSASRLLHYRRSNRSVAHRRFDELPKLLLPGDLLVLNDTRVMPAKFALVKPAGGHVEALFLRQSAPRIWDVMLKNVGGSRLDHRLAFVNEPQLTARLLEDRGAGQYRIEVSTDEPAAGVLERLGRMPLPPYIKRGRGQDDRDASDRQRYQTVYARTSGSVAAPTAGLHFTDEILGTLDELDVQRCFVTLHVGLGTFKPITAQQLADHVLHRESYSISPEAAQLLNSAKDQHRRIIAVGTTAARVLESQPGDRPFVAKTDETDIFIYPPYRWRHVNGLITNFHLPRSTLIALVAALVGLDEQRRLYQIAIQERYRFFSYGDVMFVE